LFCLLSTAYFDLFGMSVNMLATLRVYQHAYLITKLDFFIRQCEWLDQQYLELSAVVG
jgi:hypothetical protein